MTTIVTRTTVGNNTGKGSPLTHTEVDTNFVNLNTAKLETAAIPLGTLGAPSISFLNYSTTGIYSPAGDELGVSMLGSDKIRIKSTGEIIINATASRTTLGVTPRLQIEGSSTSSQCSMSLTGAGAGSSLIPRLYLSKARSSVNAIVLEDDILGLILFNGGDGSSLVNAGFIKAEVDGTPSAGIVPGRLVFATVDTAGGSGERMIIKNNGNVSIDGTTFNVDAVNNRVGIGTTTGPGGTLDVKAAASTHPLIVQGPSSEFARIDSSGRLLVGTSTSYSVGSTVGAVHQVSHTANTISASFTDWSSIDSGAFIVLGKAKGGALGNYTAVANGDTLGAIRFAGADGTDLASVGATIDAQVDGTPGADDMPGRLVFSTTPDGGSLPTTSPSAMTINSGQEVLIGYSTDNGAYKLQVNSQIFATSATIATSDGRYKENVATLDGCVDLVKALRPISFDWKHQESITRINEEGKTVVVREAHNFPDGTQVGFIAQEVQKVLTDKPWLGSVIKQNVRPAVTDSEGNELAPKEEFLGIAEGNLIAVLTSALQEAIGRIEQLESTVKTLQGE